MTKATGAQAGLVVVGVDDTAASRAALAFALAEAERTGDAVEVVTAWHAEVPPMSYPVWPVVGGGEDREVLRGAAEQVQREAMAQVGVPAGVTVSQQVVEGNPGMALVKAAREARMLVVGSRSLGVVRAAVLGSTSRYCAHHAEGPVVVVPAPHGEHEQTDRAHAGVAATS